MSDIISSFAKPEELTPAEWWRFSTVLAHYDIVGASKDRAIPAFSHFICQFLASAAQNATAAEICDLLKNEFDGRWVVGEISDALMELEKTGYVKKTRDPGGVRFAVKEPYRSQSVAEQERTALLRDNTLRAWRVELKQKYPALSSNEVQLLVEDLDQLSVLIFDKRGAEGVALIYGTELRKEELLSSFETEDLPFLPKRSDQVDAVRHIELIDFFRKSSGDRSRYIGHFLHSSFLKNAITVDPKFTGVLLAQFEGSTAVLDTNFLFCLFGFEGQIEEEVATAAIQLSKALGIRFLVHRVTIHEFRNSLEVQGRLLESFPMPRKELADSITKVLSMGGALGAYYKRYSITGVTWDDWIQPFYAIEGALSEKGIEVTTPIQR